MLPNVKPLTRVLRKETNQSVVQMIVRRTMLVIFYCCFEKAPYLNRLFTQPLIKMKLNAVLLNVKQYATHTDEVFKIKF